MKYLLFAVYAYFVALVLMGGAIWLLPRSWVTTLDRVLFS